MIKVKRIFKILWIVLLCLILLLACLMILSKLNIGGVKVLTVKSGSMSPKIPTGSIIFVAPSDAYRTGDVITFRAQNESEYVTHRVVEVSDSTGQTTYRTKGDANDTPDSYLVPPIGVIGKVRLHLPLLGYLFEFSKTVPGLIIIIIIPATVIIYEEIKKISSEWKRLRLEKENKRKSAQSTADKPSAAGEQAKNAPIDKIPSPIDPKISKKVSPTKKNPSNNKKTAKVK